MKNKTDANFEKLLTLETGRNVKLVIGPTVNFRRPFESIVEVLIKDRGEEDFRPPIGVSHPKYWKLRKLNREQAQQLQLEYSGARAKHLRRVQTELKKMNALEVN